MVLTKTTACDFGESAPEFDLPGVDGRRHSLDDVAGERGTLVMFICNHCPYVKAVIDDIVEDAAELRAHGVGSVAIMPNDTAAYSEDSFENMQRLSCEKRFSFPYLLDETQEISRAYGAVCTPDFFGFNAERNLQYRGRIHELVHLKKPSGARRELFEAMKCIADSGVGPEEQFPSMGCSIKWKS